MALVVLVACLWLSRRPPPFEVERRALADQIGLRLDRLSLYREMRYLLLNTVRVWEYHPSDDRPARASMFVDTFNGRLRAVGVLEYLPSLTGEDGWTSPVALPGEPRIEVVRMYGLGAHPVLQTPEERAQDLAIMALAAVLGVPVTDGEDRSWQPRLMWEGNPVEYPMHLQTVSVELRLRPAANGLPRQVRITLIPETRQLSSVFVDRW